MARDLRAQGLTPQQSATGRASCARRREPEWKDDLEKNYWSNDFMTSAEFRKDSKRTTAKLEKAVLVDLGLAKQIIEKRES